MTTDRRPRTSITFRLTPDIHEQLTAYAEQTHRSMNAALLALLEKSLRDAIRRKEYVPPAKPHHDV